MPIHCPIAAQRITQEEFRQIAGEVVQHVFAIHNEFGRFFDEQIYTKELVDRMDGVELEVPVTVTHDLFSIGLYEEAVTHFLGGEDRVLLPVPVIGGKRHIANQRMRMAAPNVAFKITALRSRLGEFESHAKRLIGHATLETVHWANITQASVTFTTLTG